MRRGPRSKPVIMLETGRKLSESEKQILMNAFKELDNPNPDENILKNIPGFKKVIYNDENDPCVCLCGYEEIKDGKTRTVSLWNALVEEE